MLDFYWNLCMVLSSNFSQTVTVSLTKAASRLSKGPSTSTIYNLNELACCFFSLQFCPKSSGFLPLKFSHGSLSCFWSHFQNIFIHTVDAFVQILFKMWISIGFLVFICGLRCAVAEMNGNHCYQFQTEWNWMIPPLKSHSYLFSILSLEN